MLTNKTTSTNYFELVISACYGTPKYRNIEPLGGLQKGCEIHRWQLRVAQPSNGAYNP